MKTINIIYGWASINNELTKTWFATDYTPKHYEIPSLHNKMNIDQVMQQLDNYHEVRIYSQDGYQIDRVMKRKKL